ncbi:sodium channel protein Nach [Anopheles ziemanni]|uniref:sodium channel protein Nach n=1 Tax=Anopheles coustani TaxID=139045 RepID=UPI00265A73ED|nr:sodium channel protein Nach [Anopheles coustani]XP_058177368.1 sodium channel protein Nach [Anopheles ziemanni]
MRQTLGSSVTEEYGRNVQQTAPKGPLGWLVRLFKSISTFVLIFLEQGAVHGVAHLGKPFLHIVEKIFWFSLVVIALYFSVVLSFVSWERYQSHATVVAIEKDHYYWNTSMPSLTICPMRRIYKPYLQSYCNKNGITDQDEQAELFEFLESLANSSFFNFEDIKHSEKVDSLLEMLQIRPENYMNLIYNLTRDLTRIDDTELRVRTQSNLEFLRTYQTLTEYGICYTTNSFISSNLTASLLLTGKQLPEDEFYSTRIVHTVRFGNLFDGDITYSFIGFEPPISIFYHSPYETLNIAKFQPMTSEAHEYETFSIEIVTTKDFKEDTTISQRGCRFTYESNLTHYSIYTKDICLQECRIQMAYKLCGCIPHFYPNPAGSNMKKVCHYRQLMKCFPRYQKLFLEFQEDNNDNKGIPCYCEQNCVGSKVIIENKQVLKQTQKLIGSIGGLVVMKRYPLVRFSRQLLFTFTDLLVSIGGTAGFFLGFSVLGMVEILYFFTLRLLWYIVGRR